jgi:hemoglobin-like flavoprotein
MKKEACPMLNLAPAVLSLRDVETVQYTFDLIRDNTLTFVASFYAHLLRLDPTLWPRFRRDVNKRGQMLMCVISVAVEGLNDLSDFMPMLHDLGERHKGYTEQFARCDSVGAALLLAIEEVLGTAFTREVGEAWNRTYTHFADTLLSELCAPDTAQVIAIRWVDGCCD